MRKGFQAYQPPDFDGPDTDKKVDLLAQDTPKTRFMPRDRAKKEYDEPYDEQSDGYDEPYDEPYSEPYSEPYDEPYINPYGDGYGSDYGSDYGDGYGYADGYSDYGRDRGYGDDYGYSRGYDDRRYDDRRGYDRRYDSRGYDSRSYDSRSYDDRSPDRYRGMQSRSSRYDDRYPPRRSAPTQRRPMPRQPLPSERRRVSPLLIIIIVVVLLLLLALAAVCFIGYRTLDSLDAHAVIAADLDTFCDFTPFGKEKVNVMPYDPEDYDASASDTSDTDIPAGVTFVGPDRLINENTNKLTTGEQFKLLLRTGINSVWSLFSGAEPYACVEAGTSGVHPSLFLKQDAVGTTFTQEPTREMLCTPGCYQLHIDGSKSMNVMLIVKDTTAPYVTVTDADLWLGDELDGSSFVSDINDFSPVFVAFDGNIPDCSVVGEQLVHMHISDIYGNKTETVSAILNIMPDEEPPVISGVKNISVVAGDSVVYKQGITVTDNRDTPDEITLTVDSSGTDLSKVGTYKVTYSAADRAGNVTSVTAAVIVISQDDFANQQVLDGYVEKVAKDIFKDGMTKTQQVRAIYDWVKHKIGYSGHADKSDPIKGAINGFKNRSGDCFTYYCCAKSLLDYCGIDNISVEKKRNSSSEARHYWSLVNVGTGWYHLDCTPRTGGFNGFMRTDKQLNSYSVSHKNSHRMESGKYPATPKAQFKE